MRGPVVSVDPIACDGHGICAELLPERIVLDDWGYPIVDARPLTADLLVHAERAVANCPALALRLRPPPLRPDGRDDQHRPSGVLHHLMARAAEQ